MINPVRLPKRSVVDHVKWVGSLPLAYSLAINVLYSSREDTGYVSKFWTDVKNYCEKRMPLTANEKEEIISKYKPKKEEKKNATQESTAPAEATA